MPRGISSDDLRLTKKVKQKIERERDSATADVKKRIILLLSALTMNTIHFRAPQKTGIFVQL